ncbi:MAG TPA: hypothetical protein VKA84_14610 [Gemmatimonadaceae bacterium]|nr:hypothetical protein [Gemmatimonadaceae bacterium]
MKGLHAFALVWGGMALGGAVGLAAGLQWAPELQARWSRVERRARPYSQRLRDPEQWRRDSAKRAAWEARARARPAGLNPREVRRVQALNTCAVSFEVRDSTWGRAQLFHARAWDRHQPGTVVAEAWAYREGGYAAGDTVTVVLPNVYCGDLLMAGYGGTWVGPAPNPVRVDVR